ncbi:hypothetical protein [Candidatus Vondammii sp. HM_W22]|uniref:hypothetical protein n=1 Tax=Candidatus Vondammii sp. HM_W22 TaxID=2687299 RepID=UPI001F1439B5|nr:hypothetical protein [Candidatus Vondammii sp. HM_W22]
MRAGIDNLFRWQPSVDEFVAPLHLKTVFQPLIDRFPKGIDNTRLDVVLSLEFTSQTQLMVRRALLHDVAENYWGESPPLPDNKDVQYFREAYTGMMELAVDRARKHIRLELIQLLQFSVIKFSLQTVNGELARLRGQLQRARSTGVHQSSGRAVEIHERLVLLAKEEHVIRYQLTSQLFKELFKLETLHLSKLRKSVLGSAWPIPKSLLFNPILQLSSLWADEQLMKHYSLVCTDRNDPDGFDGVNRLVTELFLDYLPPWVNFTTAQNLVGILDTDLSTVASRSRKEQDSLAIFAEIEALLGRSMLQAEYSEGRVSWLDTPENISRIIYSTKSTKGICTDDTVQPLSTYWSNNKWPGFHYRLIKRMLKRIYSHNLDQQILACHLAPDIYKELNQQLPVRMICNYLAGRMERKELSRKLAGMQSVGNATQVQKVLERARGLVHSTPAPHKRRRIFSFLRHFAVLRHDLKMAYQAHSAMEQIRLLSQPKDLELSRSNNTLQEFLLREELPPGQRRIRNHLIIKADVRGSTAITSELRQRKLNPASHFSINFFQPINKLLESCGAKKVFVEGDAVILSIFEYEDTPYQWLCVSHACGLAQEILKVVDIQNIKNRQHDLPELELGLGIVFSDDAPAYLYDEERPIMISSAINRADQLSSCSAVIRRSRYGGSLGWGIEVLAPLDSDPMEKETSDQLLRYNVNGIELDVSAYNKLKSELSLRAIDAVSISVDFTGRFLAGRYPDLSGAMHWLVLQESPVRIWDGLKPGEDDQRGRNFYQVITDKDLVAEVVDKLIQRRR